MAATERRGVDPRAPRGDPRRRRRRAAGARRRGLEPRAGVAHRRRRHPRLGRRAARSSSSAPTSSRSRRGTARDRPRAGGDPRAARAHRGRPLGLDVARAEGGGESGGIRTYVLARQNDTSIVLRLQRHRAMLSHLQGGSRASVDDLRAFLAALDDPSLSKRAKLREVKTHVVGPMCHVLWAWTTGDACGPNMMTRNSYALNMGYVMQQAPVKPERAILEANMGGDKKPSLRVLPVRPRQDGARGGDARRRDGPARAAHDGRRPARALLGGHARRGRVRDAVGRVHARVGDRGDLRLHRPGSRDGRHELDGARHRRTAPRTAASTLRSASPGSRSAPSAAARPSPTRAPGSRCSTAPAPARCTASRRSSPPRRSRSRSRPPAAMATAGSENFFRAHHERGGLR